MEHLNVCNLHLHWDNDTQVGTLTNTRSGDSIRCTIGELHELGQRLHVKRLHFDLSRPPAPEIDVPEL